MLVCWWYGIYQVVNIARWFSCYSNFIPFESSVMRWKIFSSFSNYEVSFDERLFVKAVSPFSQLSCNIFNCVLACLKCWKNREKLEKNLGNWRFFDLCPKFWSRFALNMGTACPRDEISVFVQGFEKIYERDHLFL